MLVAVVPVGAAAAAPVAPVDHAGSAPNLEVLSERYNLFVYRTQKTIEALRSTNALIAANTTKIHALQTLTRARAAGLYQRAAGGITTIIPDGTPNEVARRGQYMTAADRPDWKLIHELGDSQRRLKVRRAAQRLTRDQLQRDTAAAAQAKRQLLAEAAAQAKAAIAPTGDGAGPVGPPRAPGAAPTPPPAAAPAPAAPAPAPGPAAPPPPPPRHLLPPPPAPPRPPAPPVDVARRDRGRVRSRPARQAVRVRHGRTEHLRLLRPDDGRVGRGRRAHAALLRFAGRDVPEGQLGPAAAGRHRCLLHRLPPRRPLHRWRADDPRAADRRRRARSRPRSGRRSSSACVPARGARSEAPAGSIRCLAVGLDLVDHLERAPRPARRCATGRGSRRARRPR